MTKNSFTTTLLITSLALALLTFGCDSQGPAEKAGEKVDKTVEAAKDTVEETADKITGKGPAEKVGESLDETVEEIKESAEPKN